MLAVPIAYFGKFLINAILQLKNISTQTEEDYLKIHLGDFGKGVFVSVFFVLCVSALVGYNKVKYFALTCYMTSSFSVM